jgi:hypothetical protein
MQKRENEKEEEKEKDYNAEEEKYSLSSCGLHDNGFTVSRLHSISTNLFSEKASNRCLGYERVIQYLYLQYIFCINTLFLAGARDYSPLHNIQTSSGPHSASCPCVPGALSPKVKQQGFEAERSPPPSAEVKNDRAIPPLSICLNVLLLKYRDSVTFS